MQRTKFMAFVELENKVKSVRNTIDTLTNEVIDLKSQVMNIFIFDKKQGLKLSDSLQKMLTQIQKCQYVVDVVTTRIHGMQEKSHYISLHEANELEKEKHEIQIDFEILAAKYNETYLELIKNNFWANLKDAWQRFINGVTNLTAKILTWSFTGLIRPMFGSSESPHILPAPRPFWKKIFGS